MVFIADFTFNALLLTDWKVYFISIQWKPVKLASLHTLCIINNLLSVLGGLLILCKITEIKCTFWAREGGGKFGSYAHTAQGPRRRWQVWFICPHSTGVLYFFHDSRCLFIYLFIFILFAAPSIIPQPSRKKRLLPKTQRKVFFFSFLSIFFLGY